MSKKGQSSMEFLIILGIAMTFILILGGIFFSISSTSQENLGTSQIEKIGNELMSNVERIYFRGTGNKVQYKATFPDGIYDMRIEYRYVNQSLNFTFLNISRYYAQGENSHIFFPRENFIYLTCANCNHSLGEDDIVFGNQSFSLSFLPEDYSMGPKTIAIRSLYDRVELEFIR